MPPVGNWITSSCHNVVLPTSYVVTLNYFYTFNFPSNKLWHSSFNCIYEHGICKTKFWAEKMFRKFRLVSYASKSIFQTCADTMYGMMKILTVLDISYKFIFPMNIRRISNLGENLKNVNNKKCVDCKWNDLVSP